MTQSVIDLVDCIENETDDDLIVYLAWHEQENDGMIKMKTIGKMMDTHVTLESLFSIVIWSCVDIVTEPDYYFLTRPDSLRVRVKTLPGMFKDPHIPNNLAIVTKAVLGYFDI